MTLPISLPRSEIEKVLQILAEGNGYKGAAKEQQAVIPYF